MTMVAIPSFFEIQRYVFVIR